MERQREWGKEKDREWREKAVMRERDIVRESFHEAVIDLLQRTFLPFSPLSFLFIPFTSFLHILPLFPFFSNSFSLFLHSLTLVLLLHHFPFHSTPSFFYLPFLSLFYSILFLCFFICPFFSPIHAFSSFFLSFFPFFLSFPFYPLTPVLISTICFVIEMENSLSSPLLSITLSPQGLSADED